MMIRLILILLLATASYSQELPIKFITDKTFKSRVDYDSLVKSINQDFAPTGISFILDTVISIESKFNYTDLNTYNSGVFEIFLTGKKFRADDGEKVKGLALEITRKAGVYYKPKGINAHRCISHEIGHLLGIHGHTEDFRSIMYYSSIDFVDQTFSQESIDIIKANFNLTLKD